MNRLRYLALLSLLLACTFSVDCPVDSTKQPKIYSGTNILIQILLVSMLKIIIMQTMLKISYTIINLAHPSPMLLVLLSVSL